MKQKTCKIIGTLIGPQSEIDRLIASGKDNLIVDFSECTFISVPGLEWLKEMLTKAGTTGANVSFISMPPVLYKVFKVARIENILNACGSPSSLTNEQVC